MARPKSWRDNQQSATPQRPADEPKGNNINPTDDDNNDEKKNLEK